MEKNNVLHLVTGIGLIAIAGASMISALWSRRQLKKTAKLISKATDELEDLTAVDVQQSIVDRAVTDAAEREANRAVYRAVQSVECDIHSEAMKRVRQAVEEKYQTISQTVTDAIATEAAKVDSARVMADATEKAKELLLRKFEGKLDGLMVDYQRNLDNVGRIYQSIASSMTEKAGKDVTLKLG